MMDSRKKEDEKNLAPGGIWTFNLQIMRHLLYRCATTEALVTGKFFEKVWA